MLANYLPYVLTMVLLAMGVYAIAAKRNLIKVIIGVMIGEYAVNLFLILMGYRTGGRAPIRTPAMGAQEFVANSVDPLPQALILTSIVIGLGMVALLALSVQLIGAGRTEYWMGGWNREGGIVGIALASDGLTRLMLVTVNLVALVAVLFSVDLFGAIGLVRLPDVYNRVQAATKCVTVGTCFILAGVLAHAGISALGVKAILCAVFVILTSPVGAHAIARGAHIAGVRLWSGSVVDKYEEKRLTKETDHAQA